MEFQKIIWKINFRKGKLATEDLFRFFNTQIENSPQVFVDIADYKHVPGGPEVLLVGVNADLAYDSLGGSLGLSYSQKEEMEGTNQDKLTATFSRLLDLFSNMHKYDGFPQPPELDSGNIIFILNDRALAPNTGETFEAVENELQEFFTEILGKGNFSINHTGTEKDRFIVEVKPSIELNLANLRSQFPVT